MVIECLDYQEPPGDGWIDVSCRCCGKSLRIPEEDACDLCVVCYRGKGGDTDDPCKVHQHD